MIPKIKNGAAGIAVFAASMLASGAYADTTGNPAADTSPAAVTVILPLTITRTGDLHFGSFVRGPTFANNDKINLVPGSAAVYTPMTSFSPLPSDPPRVATFNIVGAPGYEVIVTQSGPVDMQAGALRVGTFRDDPDLGNSYVLPPSGTVSYRVGGEMRVTNAAAVTNGLHSTNFVLTVNYF